MSDPADFERKATSSAGGDIFSPARASMRARLGEFADVYMDARIKIARKISDKISSENDVDKLMELRGKLNDVLLADDDIAQLDAKITAFVVMLQTNATAFMSLRNEWMTALNRKRDPHSSQP